MKIVIIALDRRERRITSTLVGLAALAFASVALADVPETFMPGQTLRASELNANFTALDERITAVENAATPSGADRRGCDI